MTTTPISAGDTAWLLIATALVFLMVPGLALFYGGLVRARAALNTFMMSFAAVAAVSSPAPIITFAANGRTYTHGYRRDMPPVIYASNSISAPVSLAQARFEPSSDASELPAVQVETANLVPTTISISL